MWMGGPDCVFFQGHAIKRSNPYSSWREGNLSDGLGSVKWRLIGLSAHPFRPVDASGSWLFLL